MSTTHRLHPGRRVRLSDISTKGKMYCSDRAEAKEELLALRQELADWQRKLYAEGKRKLLVVFQAMDCGGKDGAIRRVFRGVNPQGVRVTSFKKPTDEELAHDFLWRIHKAAPAAGMIGVFNRSQYEDVLVVRVEKLAPESVWRARYEQINQFESRLIDTGTTILKFYLHISKQQQRKRLQDRLANPQKNWKFNADDLKKRADWDHYMTAYEEMLCQCGVEQAPWYVIPADQRWYRDLAIARVIVDALRQMDPTYPKAAEGIEKIVVD